jgi:DNA-binding CsgD family transcriptional regulator/tetratricopeptide (TPR) repeat protein
VRATLDWSYALLSETEQVLFERLSIFAGGWTLEAAEVVTAADGLSSDDVLGLLGRLVDTSMVVAEPGAAGDVRYRLLESVRQYAAERLTSQRSYKALLQRHSEYFLDLAEQTAPRLANPDIRAAQLRLQAEHANLRAALGSLLDRGDADRCQRLAGALGRFWFFQGSLAESHTWLTRALAMAGGDRPTLDRARCLFGMSMLLTVRGEYAAIQDVAEEACSIFHSVGEPVDEAYCLFVLGTACVRLGKYPEARAYLEAGIAASRAAHDPGAESACLYRLAMLAIELEDNDNAQRWAQAALAAAMAIGQVVQIADAHLALGVVSSRQGDYVAAARSLQASLATWRELGARWFIAETLLHLGELALEQGDFGIARARLREGLVVARELGDRFTIAVALERYAQLAALEERWQLSLEFAATAERLRDELGAALSPADQRRLERYLARAQRAVERSSSGVTPTMDVAEAIDAALAPTPTDKQGHAFRRETQLLTPREQTVARLIARGKTNRQIAEQLVIAEGTAERHVGNILAKLDMSGRSQIAAWAVARGLAAEEIPTEV